MANHVIKASAPTSVLPSGLGALRQHIQATLLGNLLFSAAEHLRVNHFIHQCEDLARLARRYANLRATLDRLHPLGFRGHRPRQPEPVPAWVPGTPLPNRADHRASTFDRRSAARFEPANSLALAHLLSPVRP
ncbi:hypothetical protein A0257_22185 [Hymenobacter psoromatis]|nr:hypothetical protein A0257_22185 [Hymenobacter psoromatis]